MVTWLRVQTIYGAHVKPGQDPDRHNWRKSYGSKPNHVQQNQFVKDAIAAHERAIISVIGQAEYDRLGKRPESDGNVSISDSRPDNATDLP
ncbi:hypothetical protein FRC12_000791 [Ceratobasidium sp. 428]|nr:hypothetical protein FRC09_008104 [Ceratobasidium sp. 395]KAG8769934.1 hypothetical protein FRC12_004631 [Ceratobasidium sp. 428]KAG8776661.1 hypothetical protein FRC12_000791 [Ceratobasidium sp. 428]